MERKKKKEGGGFYIAICCCALIIAAVGYANRLSLKEETPAPEENNIAQKEKQEEINIKSSEPKATMQPQPEKKAEVAEETPVVVNKNVQVEEKIQFESPVKGKVVEEYSGDDLVYNEALKDWRAHSGVDFAAELGEQVVCSAKGVVEQVFDSSLGRCVIVDHQNGFKTMYANLAENTQVKEGDELMQGDVIGAVGNTALGDRTDEPHLHFEITKQNENINPVEYLE